MQDGVKQVKVREMEHFLTLPGEKLLIAQRKHWITVILPVTLEIWLFLFLLFFSYLLMVTVLGQFPLFLLTAILFSLLFLTLISKTITDWYFHFYVITTKKIMEFDCSPLFSHSINEVLLDQVRCTEIDVQTRGIINHLLDKGSVIVTFDRPTHQEELLFTDIHNPRRVGTYLADTLNVTKGQAGSNGIWFRRGHGKSVFTEELQPPRREVINL